MIRQMKIITKDDNLHLIIPLLIRVIARSNYSDQKADVYFKVEIVETISSLVMCKTFREFTATIVHTMLNVIEVYHSYTMREAGELHKSIIDLFCRMAG